MGKYLIKIARAGFPEAKAEESKTSEAAGYFISTFSQKIERSVCKGL